MKQAQKAIWLIGLLGIVAMLSDMSHEGAASVLGDFLRLTGASATAIGFVSGFGELLGYGLRILSGKMVDKTKRYWLFIFIGYGLQVIAIPCLALVGEHGWIWACLLLFLERIGKAIKKPAKNTIVSFASSQIGEGKGFGFEEFLDQFGAFLGPILLFFVFMKKQDMTQFHRYQIGFLLLGIPAILTLVLLWITKILYPNPQIFHQDKPHLPASKVQSKLKYYLLGVCFYAFGMIDFPLITYYIAKHQLFNPIYFSLVYSLAMFVDAISALYFGALFDKIKGKALMIVTILSSFFSLLIFTNHHISLILLGVVCWGISMGGKESIMKSMISHLTTSSNRSSAFGLFEGLYGISWFLGSVLLGYAFEHAMWLVIVIPFISQWIAIYWYRYSESL